jgi:hypothetical protein
MRAKGCAATLLGILLVATAAISQTDPLSIRAKEIPEASLWGPYNFRLQAAGGIPHYHWRIASGSLPPDLQMNDAGEITGAPQESGQYEFEALLTDSNRPPQVLRKKFTLAIETPLAATWSARAKVSGNRIDGAIKVSNHTARDFDLTMVVLAVNDLGRATAIGYQHFPLKANTRDLEIPFGDTLSRGNYAVNVDVVGEEPVSNRIFRARLVTKQSVSQGP